MAFESILSVLGRNTKRVSVTSASLGSFYLDATVNESHMAKLRVTDNPIESGSSVTDHSVIDPKEVSLTGIVVGYSQPLSLMSEVGLDSVDLSSYPLPVEVKAWASAAESTVNQAVNDFKRIKSQADTILSDYVPNIENTKFDTSSTSDRISMAYDALLTLQASGEFLEVLTSSKLYKNMLITSISVTQENSMSASIGLTFREVFIVGTQVGKGLVAGKKKTKTANLGKTTPKKVSSESWFNKILN